MALVAFKVAQLVVVVGAVVERLGSGLLFGRPRVRPEEDGAGRAQRQRVGHPGGVGVRRDRGRMEGGRPPVLVVLVRRRQWRRRRGKVAFAAFLVSDRIPVVLGPHLGVEGVRPRRRRRPPRPGAVRPRRDGRRGRLNGVGPPEQPPVGLVVVELLLVEGTPLVVATDEVAFFAAFVLSPPGGGLEGEGGLVGGGGRRGGRRGGGEADELPVDPLRASVSRADAAGEDIVLGPRLAAAAACRLVSEDFLSQVH